ncbi:MAG: alpha/beta hydrolase [Dehalococcoidia bacterium]|nr:alpha/beta hydrolase [Dehalococcoidia bacterium]
MAKRRATTGYSTNGLPYACFGNGTRNLVVFDGLDFRHKPPSGIMLRMSTGYLSGLTIDYRIYFVSRRPGLPLGYSLKDMSDDYAVMIKNELGGADIIGVSTGGAIAQYFAIDHPDLVRRLVLVMTGCRQTEQGKELLRKVADLARKRKRRAAYSLLGTAIIRKGIARHVFKWFMWLLGPLYIPADPSDGIVEIEADDRYDLSDQLNRIKADTLVIGGEEDFFYAIRETAGRIPNARLVLYPDLGHNAMFARSRQFGEETRAFLLS